MSADDTDAGAVELVELVEELQFAAQQMRELPAGKKLEMEMLTNFSADAIAYLYDKCRDTIARLTLPAEPTWQPMSKVPKHGRRIYLLERGGQARIAYANPELDRSNFLAWWPVPEHGSAALAITKGGGNVG